MPSLFDVTAGKLIGPVAGGSVTQTSDKTTAVTLNTETGVVTMDGAALGAGAEATFQVNNDKVAAADVPQLAIASGGTAGSYLVGVSAVAAGSFKITVTNVSGSSLSEAVVINFVVLKGSAS